MISDVDAALNALLKAEALNGSDTDVVFDAPTTEWAAKRSGPVIDAFMYDIREEVERRSAGALPKRNDAGRVTGLTPQPRYYRLSYLLTAWTSRPQDEHELLGRLLENLIKFDWIPDSYLRGRLAGEQV